ncbi:MAG: phage major tail tube protein [Peptoniphilus harei]|nr:phage major tail tube protein [Peptoniphilus harei]
MRIPDKLVGFNVFSENRLLGVADITLPSIEYMTETLSGAGIAGETETPALGQVSSMSVQISMRTQHTEARKLLELRGQQIDVRGSLQEQDSSTGEIRTYPCRVSMFVLPKTYETGKFEVGSTTDTSIESEVTYMRMWIDNQEIVEIDKFNYICRINGKDYLEEVRSQIGM